MGQQILLIIHILLAVVIIGLVLLQQGKGAEVGAAFGSGASQTLFGSRGSASFLAKLTAAFAIAFAITSLSMGYMTTHRAAPKSILDKIEEVQKAEEIPALAEEETDVERQAIGVNKSDAVTVKSKAKASKKHKKTATKESNKLPQ